MADSQQNTEKTTELISVDLAAELPAFVDLLPDRLQTYWRILDVYPILQAVLIALLFLLLAYVIRRFVLNAVCRQIAMRLSGAADSQVIAMLNRPVFVTVICIGLIIALSSSGLPGGLVGIAVSLIGSVLVLVWLGFSFRLAGLFTSVMSTNDRLSLINDQSKPLLSIVFKIVVIMVGVYTLFILWGINPVGFLASAGIAGIAIGFAAKDTLANLFSGFFIIADMPYKLGDYINLDTGERGKVIHIGLRSTRLLTRDDIEVIIPNGVIGNAKIVNETGGPSSKLRLRLSVQVSYEADLEEVCSLLTEIAENHPGVCEIPPAAARVRGFADSGVNIELLCWIDNPELRGRTLHQLYLATRQAFREKNLEIPYPKRDIYLQNASGDKVSQGTKV